MPSEEKQRHNTANWKPRELNLPHEPLRKLATKNSFLSITYPKGKRANNGRPSRRNRFRGDEIGEQKFPGVRDQGGTRFLLPAEPRTPRTKTNPETFS